MQTAKLDQSYRIEPMHAKFSRLFDFVKNNDFDALPLGKIEIEDGLFIMNNDINGTPREKQPLEMHREYIDVHILLKGNEEIGIKPTGEIEHYTKEYDSASDCALSDDTPRYYINLKPGEFCIVYPEDAHAPAIGYGPIRKLIGKVRVH